MNQRKALLAENYPGAPAIAIVAALALAVELFHRKDGKRQNLVVKMLAK